MIHLNLWSADALAQHHFKDLYLLHPIIPQGGIVFFYGKRNIGKTCLVQSLVLSVLEGGRWLGKYQAFPGPVVYIQADMTASIQQQRVRAALRYHRMDNLHFLFPSFFNIGALQADTDIVQKINVLKPKLVVWDTLRKITRGDLVTDDSLPSFIYGKAKDLFPGATHLFVHHDKKTIADQDKLDEEEMFRGSGALIDDADTGMHLNRVGGGRLMLTFPKTRTCAEQPSVPLILHPETLLVYASGDAAKLCADHWRSQHPTGSPDALERFLLASFVGTPRIARFLAHGDPGDGTEIQGGEARSDGRTPAPVGAEAAHLSSLPGRSGSNGGRTLDSSRGDSHESAPAVPPRQLRSVAPSFSSRFSHGKLRTLSLKRGRAAAGLTVPDVGEEGGKKP